MDRGIKRGRHMPLYAVAAVALIVANPQRIQGLQGAARAGGQAAQGSQAGQSGRAAAPVDLTGYWVSLIVDERRFRVTPKKGDILYLPLNAEARPIANEWDPDKDITEGNQCKAYGAVGVTQRPGRLHITWENDNTLRIDADAGTQARLLHFGQPPAQRGGDTTWQGY